MVAAEVTEKDPHRRAERAEPTHRTRLPRTPVHLPGRALPAKGRVSAACAGPSCRTHCRISFWSRGVWDLGVGTDMPA